MTEPTGPDAKQAIRERVWDWNALDRDKIAAIPVLAAMANER
ncbi:MAG TPA: hypothetical protein VGO16_16130 [Pseudonocardiaceae bacterium]|nr:hypothetical protein [Pseudonocardiaceae bacterium]